MTVNVTCIRLTICRAGARSRQIEEYKGTSDRRVVEDSCDAQKIPAMLSSRVDADPYLYLFGLANVEHQESDRKPIPIRLRSCHPDARSVSGSLSYLLPNGSPAKQINLDADCAPSDLAGREIGRRPE
jgi:hypothetical protein